MQKQEEPPPQLEVSFASLVELAVECWRLERRASAAGPEGAPARHAARRLGKFLAECDISVLDLTGQRYEAGLAVEVLDITSDESLSEGAEIIEEMIAPVVLWRGAVVRHGQAIVRRGGPNPAG